MMGMGSLPQGLGQPPQASAVSPTFFSHFYPCCRPAQHFSYHTSRQQQLLFVDTESSSSFLSSSKFRSSFHGETEALDQRKILYQKNKAKETGEVSLNRRPTRTIIWENSNRSFQQSYQPRGNFNSAGRQSTRTSSLALESHFTGHSNVDQKSDRHLNSLERFDQRKSSPSRDLQSVLEVGSKPVGTVSISELMRPAPLEGTTSGNARSGVSSQLASKVEPSSMIAEQVVLKTPQIGQRYPGYIIGKVPSGLTSQRWVQQELNVAHGQWRSQKIPEEQAYRREDHPAEIIHSRKYEGFTSLQGLRNGNQVAQLEASPPRIQTGAYKYERSLSLQGGRYQNQVAQLETSPARIQPGAYKYERSLSLQDAGYENQVAQLGASPSRIQTGVNKYRGSLNLQGAEHENRVAQFEVSPPRIQMGAQRWGEAAKIIQQNRKPIHAAGRIEETVRSRESQNIELEPVVAFENICRKSEANEALQIPKAEELFGDEEFNGMRKSAVTEDFITEEQAKLSADDVSVECESSSQSAGEQRWMNAEVLVVDNLATAESVVEKLRGQYKDFIHACDTEVAEIDVKKESPVGHGRLICFSIYCGPNTDFGGGKCRLWVDVLDKDAVLHVFKSYFEDPSIRKVWHNYSFDKHILGNHGINAQGFHADTMHLARLHDSARTIMQGGYSLEGLTADKKLMGDHWGDLQMVEESLGKRSMKHLFGVPNVKKNGEEGKLRVVPPVEELQTKAEWRDKWIHYASFDTVCTWCLWKSLQDKLKEKKWLLEGKFIQEGRSMYDFYLEYVQPFGELLVQMEGEGMLLDRSHLSKIEEIAIKQQEFSANQFKKWAARHCPDAIYMNVGSDAQIRQLLFGGRENKNDPDKRLEMERIFNAPNTDNFIEEGRKTPKKTRPFTLCGLGVNIPVDTYTSAGWPAVGGAALRALAGKVAIDYTVDEVEPDEDFVLANSTEDLAVLTSTGVKGGSNEDLSVYGKAYEAFGGGKEGKEACMAFAALCEVASINTLISNFIQPLQGSDIKGLDGRVHCSLNINTETGRLSARRPSLQNQPALEKDRYKIRQAFVAAPGNSLIVADYGQLELRILAHLTDCKSMLKAFVDGGDFHSRTAMNMYPHVRKAVERGDVILEWEPKPGENKPPVPLLKDIFGAERRKAKMLNFSIAYGKTAMGLSKDWKVSLDEAKSTVELWYSDRPEVRRWQEQRIREAIETHHVHTLLGRTRHFPDVNSSNKLVRGHIERAAINTPVQGSAADVAMCAMLEINRNKTLQELGWKLLLQVHDEVILEGPAESAAMAKDIVVKCMGFPFRGKNGLKVALAVDAKFAQNWYAAK